MSTMSLSTRYRIAVFLTVSMLAAFGVSTSAARTTSRQETPVYKWGNVTIKGGGFVSGIVFHPAEQGLVYARTDVGGAYRWDTANAKWLPITDWIGRNDSNYAGIESLAVDPADPGRVYLAGGLARR